MTTLPGGWHYFLTQSYSSIMKVLLLGYEDIRVKSSPSPSELHADLDLVHVAVQVIVN